MKKSIIVIFVFSLFVLNEVSSKEIKGYFINNDGERFEGVFILDISIFRTFEEELVSLQGGLRFIHKNGKKENVSPSFDKELGFMYGGERYKFLSSYRNVEFRTEKKMFSKSVRCFLRILENGNLSLLARYNYNEHSHNNILAKRTYIDYIYFKTKQFKPKKSKFKSDMSTYFLDCPKLQEKIRDKTYKEENAKEIARFYNTNCS